MTFRPIIVDAHIAFKAGCYDYTKLMNSVGGNTGNSYISYSVMKFLNAEFAQSNIISSLWDPAIFSYVSYINENFTHCIICMKDYIKTSFFGINWEEATRFIEHLRVPLVVMGLGANAINEDMAALASELPPALVRFLKSVSENSVSIGIRGEYTASILTKIGVGNLRIIGCPSYYAGGSSRKVNKPSWNEDLGILALGLFANKVRSKKSTFCLQDEEFALSLLMETNAFLPEKILTLDQSHPGYFDTLIEALLEDRVTFFFNMSEWEQAIKGRYNLAIGTRMHGAIAALNAGIPAVVTAGDARAMEMCQFFHMHHYPGWGFRDVELEAFYEQLSFDEINEVYPALYANYLEFLHENGLLVRNNPQEMSIDFGVRAALVPPEIKFRRLASSLVYLVSYGQTHPAALIAEAAPPVLKEAEALEKIDQLNKKSGEAPLLPAKKADQAMPADAVGRASCELESLLKESQDLRLLLDGMKAKLKTGHQGSPQA